MRLSKLKDDMIETRASIAILGSVVLPNGIKRFGQVDGVWVSDLLCAIPLAAALREHLEAISRERTASTGKNEKMEALYQYLAGVEFKQKIEGISYKDNYEGNALAAMLAAGKVEIRYHQQFSDNRVASIMASLMEQPRLSFMKGWKVTYQGRVLSVPKVYPLYLIFPKKHQHFPTFEK